MWKRDQATFPDTGNESPAPAPAPAPSSPPPSTRPQAAAATPARDGQATVPIGKSVVLKGELSGNEDLVVEGTVEGTIELRENVLTIGASGRIKAQVFAKTVIVWGTVNGTITASERIEIRDQGSVDGNIASPRVAIADGAYFRGNVDMQKKGPHLVKPVAQHEPVQRPAPEKGTHEPVAAVAH